VDAYVLRVTSPSFAEEGIVAREWSGSSVKPNFSAISDGCNSWCSRTFFGGITRRDMRSRARAPVYNRGIFVA